jgi:endo-1,4-beta-mannosidase
MNRRQLLQGSAALAVSSSFRASFAPGGMAFDAPPGPLRLDTGLHRFGVNYTPSHNWWFCWNDWDADPIRRDLDAIASLAADHLRLLLIWPYFQPNPKWVSSLHLERLDQLLTLMAERHLDALITVFTGQLSGWYFLPPFNKTGEAFFTDAGMWAAQELFIRELARVVAGHDNVIGFDLGNEINTCWSAGMDAGDAWMARMFQMIDSVLPGHLNVNGVDHHPWFEPTTFSPQVLAHQRMPVIHCYPWWTGALKYGGPMDPPSVRLLAGMAALVRSYAGSPQKPVWAGEFNTCIEALTEKQQAAWLERAVNAAIEEGVGWFTYWDSHDVDRRFAFNSVEYSLGLMTNDGRVKEQGRMFRELALAHQGKAVQYPAAPLPPPPDRPTQDSTWHWLLGWMGWRG